MKKEADIRCLCELMENPVGIDLTAPRFSWGSDVIFEKQKGYRIVVSDTKEFILPVWDSGYVESEENNLIRYDGERLKSGTRYYYYVEIFGKQQYVSPVFTFFTGILENREWDEYFIGGAGVKYHSFLIRWPLYLKDHVKTAAAFVASPNYYQLTFDGNAVRDTKLNNAFTEYTKTLLYETYPLPADKGEHVLGIEMGNGWYAMEMGERGAAKGEHVLAIQIRIEYWDGTVEWLTSDCDNCFCSSFAPAVQNSIYRGETHDARLKQEGFDTAEFTMDEGKRWEKRSGRIPRGERSVPR